MSDQNSAAPHQPGVYAKGEQVRVASSVAEATALVFDGFAVRSDEPAPEPDLADEPEADPADDGEESDEDAEYDEDTNDENPLAPETDSGLPAGFTPPTPSPSLFTR